MMFMYNLTKYYHAMNEGTKTTACAWLTVKSWTLRFHGNQPSDQLHVDTTESSNFSLNFKLESLENRKT
jgi:hypothetical protein